MLNVSHFDTRPYRVVNPKESADLQAFITANEAKALKRVLGYDLYTELIAGLAVTPVEDIESRWLALRDGDTYTYNSKTYEYKGLVDLLVPCIFSDWLRESKDKFTSVGVVRTEAQETKPVSPDARIIEAWDEYCDKVGGVCEQCGTLYGYLQNSDNDYTSLVFTQPLRVNKFGI